MEVIQLNGTIGDGAALSLAQTLDSYIPAGSGPNGTNLLEYRVLRQVSDVSADPLPMTIPRYKVARSWSVVGAAVVGAPVGAAVDVREHCGATWPTQGGGNVPSTPRTVEKHL